jgi:hypothetical protein
MYEFHPSIMQKIFNKNFLNICVINPQKLFLTGATSTESRSMFWKLSYLCCWTLWKFSLHTNVADYLRLKHFILMLVFMQCLKTDFYIATDELYLPKLKESILIGLIAYLKQNPVGCMN